MNSKSTIIVSELLKTEVARLPRSTARGWSLRRAVATVLLMPFFIGPGLPAVEPGARTADALLRLVPPDAAVVLTIEGLREQIRALTGSRLAAELWELPRVRAWLNSERYQQLEQTRAHIEAALGVNLTELCDELLGDAVVLAVHPLAGRADEIRARGLLLFRA
jgi:hypothetical protein